MPIAPDALSDSLIEIPDQTQADAGRPGFTQDDANEPDEEFSAFLGFILDEKDTKKVARHIDELCDDQEPVMARNRAVWKRSAWWREGRRWVRLEKKENLALWEAKLPPGMANAPPVPNKTDRLCRRTVNVIMVDPPYPECEPGDASNEAKDAAEFSTRYLEVKGSPNELNMTQVCRTALDKAMTYASSFAWVITDPSGAGWRPRQMLAHPQAPDADSALEDPATEQPASEEQMTLRYVTPTRQLTDNAQEADLQWLPGPKIRFLTGKNLIMLPATATSLRDADGVVITDFTTLGDLKKQFPDALEKLSDEDFQALCEWKPKKVKDLLPMYAAEPKDQKYDDRQGRAAWKDSQTIWTRTVYYGQCAEYPKGCYAIKAGKETILYRDPYTAMMDQPDDGEGNPQPAKEEVLRIPIAQCRCLDDNDNDNGYGIGMAEKLGPGDEIRASSLGYQLEYMFRFGNPLQFLPMGSIVQPKQLMLRDGNPVYFNPQGTPVTEAVPQLPAVVPELRAEMGEEMNDESGLQETGQGVESPDVHSGVHARTVVQEALKAISNMKDNLEFFYIDLNTILLEQARAFAAVPTMLSYTGKDGEYKEREWSKTDFRNTKVVSIRRGSFTMHTLVAKQELANDAMDRKVIDPEEYKELVAGGVSPILGYQDNPHLMRIRRQLDVFDNGPPPGYDEAVAAYEQGQQQQAALEQQAQTNASLNIPPPPLPAGPPPVKPPGPFDDQLAVDDEPMAAKIRWRQLSNFMATSKYTALKQKSPAWAATFEAEYQRAKNSAGIMTVPDVQKAQAQQAEDAKAAALVAKTSIGVKADPTNVAATEEAVQQGATAAAAGETTQIPTTTQAASPGPPGETKPAQQIHLHIHATPQSDQQSPVGQPPIPVSSTSLPPAAPPPIPGI